MSNNTKAHEKLDDTFVEDTFDEHVAEWQRDAEDIAEILTQVEAVKSLLSEFTSAAPECQLGTIGSDGTMEAVNPHKDLWQLETLLQKEQRLLAPLLDVEKPKTERRIYAVSVTRRLLKIRVALQPRLVGFSSLANALIGASMDIIGPEVRARYPALADFSGNVWEGTPPAIDDETGWARVYDEVTTGESYTPAL